jgi:phosphoribosylformylglycinamidine synthase
LVELPLSIFVTAGSFFWMSLHFIKGLSVALVRFFHTTRACIFSSVLPTLNFIYPANHYSPLGVAVATVVVNVALKPEILDPQGRAVSGALGRLGLTGVTDVRQGKQFVLTLDGEVDAAKRAEIEKIAETLLSNPVIEDFTIEIHP